MRHALLPLALLALCACTPRDEGKPATAGEADAPTAGEAVASNHAFQDGIDAGDQAWQERVGHPSEPSAGVLPT